MTAMPALLVVNAGSSTVKSALFTTDREPLRLASETMAGAAPAAAARVIDWASRARPEVVIAGIGHRIVHGGPHFHEPQRLTPSVIDVLTALTPFAPNHLPDELALVSALGARFPGVPQVACFDTAFHAHLPDVARRLPIPRALDAQGVRRYGFHGLSYSYLLDALERIAGHDAASGRVVLAHLGNGSSLAAVRHRKSVDVTMAFTPTGGVMMSTRSGDLDPGVVTFIAREGRLSPDAVEDLLSRQSGLVGVSGESDMRVLLDREDADPACRLAVSMYVYAVRKAIGALAAALGGLETLVFSGGIGEHSPAIRERVCDSLAFLGVRLDRARNASQADLISSGDARVAVRVIPTNEELMIARAVLRLLQSG